MPSYYTTLPATIRYAPDLSADIKILYSELEYLSRKNGYCWPTNEHLGRLFGIAPETISRWLGVLKKAAYIEIKYIKHNNPRMRRQITPFSIRAREDFKKKVEKSRKRLTPTYSYDNMTMTL